MYLVTVYGIDKEVYLAVINQEMHPRTHVVGYIGIAEIYGVFSGHSCGVTDKSHLVTGLKFDILVIGICSGAYLGAFGVHQYAYRW